MIEQKKCISNTIRDVPDHRSYHTVFKKKLNALWEQLNRSSLLELDNGGIETDKESVLSAFLIYHQQEQRRKQKYAYQCQPE